MEEPEGEGREQHRRGRPDVGDERREDGAAEEELLPDGGGEDHRGDGAAVAREVEEAVAEREVHLAAPARPADQRAAGDHGGDADEGTHGEPEGDRDGVRPPERRAVVERARAVQRPPHHGDRDERRLHSDRREDSR